MKKWLLLFSIVTTSIFSQTIETEPSKEFLTDPLFEIENAPPPFFPFSMSGSYVDVSRAHLRTSGFQRKNIHYRQWEIAYAYTQPLSPIYGLIFGAGWVGSEVSMQDNPEFNETFFNYVNFSIGGFANVCTNWSWTVTFAGFLDTEVFSLVDYALYQGVIWGKYTICPTLQASLGLITETGLKQVKAWPIVGLVYTPARRFRVNAVYPINMSIEYDIASCWTLAASVRLLRNRHRVKEDEPNPRAIFQYQTWGGELDSIFSPFEWFMVKGFVGSTVPGDLKISDLNGNHSTYFKFQGSFYAGVSAILSF